MFRKISFKKGQNIPNMVGLLIMLSKVVAYFLHFPNVLHRINTIKCSLSKFEKQKTNASLLCNITLLLFFC